MRSTTQARGGGDIRDQRVCVYRVCIEKVGRVGLILTFVRSTTQVKKRLVDWGVQRALRACTVA